MIALNTVVRNEAHRILGLLEHAAVYCDELVVVDQDSDDGTADLARVFGAKVIMDVCHGANEPSRELASDSTDADWILALDADEILSPEAVELLPMIMESYHGAAFPRLNYVDGVLTNPWFNDGMMRDYQFRFFRRGRVIFDPGLHGRIHALFDMSLLAYHAPPSAAIMHTKSSAEVELDAARYQRIADAVS